MRACVYMYACCVFVCARVCVIGLISFSLSNRMCVRSRACLWIVCVYVCVCVFMHVCLYVLAEYILLLISAS